MADVDMYRYWGKAGKNKTESGINYHLLPYHSLDVAATGRLLLCPSTYLCQKLAKRLGVEPQWLQEWFCFCLMLHDIGKFCRGFQNLACNSSADLVPFDAGSTYNIRHDSLGFHLWQSELLPKRLADCFPDSKLNRTKISPWIAIVCGHHGQPPRKDLRQIKTSMNPEEDIPAAEAFVREAVEHWMPDLAPLESMDKKLFLKTSWQLAGIAVLADWLGSDQSIFQYQSEVEPLPDYWYKKAVPGAKEVLQNVALQPKQIQPFQSIKQQFSFIRHPTPLQDFAESVTIPDSPQLFILEDVTGAGKTEAAMVLAHRLMSKGLANGLYVGLPTMATANGMYNRLAKSYQSLFDGAKKPSLVLAHSASKLSDSFQESIHFSNQPQDKSYQLDELSAGAYCNQWLADSRKKSLLADVGVGTIDQALLGVLPARHQSLRLLGISDKVLLIDEVHAYDPYVRQLMSALLQAHAAQGGSAILLSATLPQQFRTELTTAYIEGRGFQSESAQLAEAAGYPLVTHYSDKDLTETPIETRDSVKRTVKVQRLVDEASAFALIEQATQTGKSICWIRNTVKDAHNAYRYIQDSKCIFPEKSTLFHSRFTMLDRQRIEGDVLARFGKDSTGELRAGQLLIATQVVEQSLDLDFDVMISDLAPVDLLIQRAGRLQRHIRDDKGNRITTEDGIEQRSTPCLYLLTPDPEEVESKQWLRSLLPGSQAVYGNVGQMWLTARVLLQKQRFSMPEDARYLVESVYGEKAQERIPECLQQETWNAEAEDKAKQAMGKFNRLNLDKGYCLESAEHNAGWSEDTHIPTRLTEVETVTVVLVTLDEAETLQPYARDANSTHCWALSQINLPENAWLKAKTLIPQQYQTAIDTLKQQHSHLKWLEIFPLVSETEQLYQLKEGWG